MASVEILDESIFSGSSGGDEDCLHVILKLERPDYISLVLGSSRDLSQAFSVDIVTSGNPFSRIEESTFFHNILILL